MDLLYVLDLLARFTFFLLLIYYSATNLQWYSYSPFRVIFKHHKKRWHLFYFVIPLAVFLIFGSIYDGIIFDIYVFFLMLPSVSYWIYKLDKKLQFTKRVIRLCVITILFIIFNELLMHFSEFDDFYKIVFLLPLIFGFIISFIYEWNLLKNYISLAKNKLKDMPSLQIIAITGSYGKTSTKNFIAQILKLKYDVYATPRSVNTYKGIIDDINKNLDYRTDIYIAEAGARNKGDILEITNLLNPQIGVIGKIGAAHIEYFKSLDTIYETKFELLSSALLKTIYVQKDNKIPNLEESAKINLSKIKKYPYEIRNIKCDLDSTCFEMNIKNNWEEFHCNILGRFNVDNIAVSIMIGLDLGINLDTIKKAVKKLESTPHRLNKLTTHNKVILDDSFNGNLEGMSEAIRLASLYEGRKVIVTPGLVESNYENNKIIASRIDEVFDLVIITGELNSKVLNENISHTQKILLKDKSQLEDILKSFGLDNDLVLFANDAHSYI